MRERGVDCGSHAKWVLDFPKTILFYQKKIYIFNIITSVILITFIDLLIEARPSQGNLLEVSFFRVTSKWPFSRRWPL